MARPKKARKFVQLNCRITEEMEVFIEGIADDMGIPRSVVGGELIKLGVECCQAGRCKLFTNYDIQPEQFALLNSDS